MSIIIAMRFSICAKVLDSNIDCCRVPNLRVFFKCNGKSLPVSHNGKDYHPGSLSTTMPGLPAPLKSSQASAFDEDGLFYRCGIRNTFKHCQRRDFIVVQLFDECIHAVKFYLITNFFDRFNGDGFAV